MDASAIFFAVRDLFENHQLDYSKLTDLLCEKTGTRRPPIINSEKSDAEIWAMWTSFHAQNTGQARFLEYAESTLGWSVRRVDPADSYLVDPQTTLGISKSQDGGASRAVNRLTRFDTGIAYSIGRIADTHKIDLISDSYTLAEPLVRSAMARRSVLRRSGLQSEGVHNYIGFFGRLLDTRWNGLLRGKASEYVKFVDLDEYHQLLFGRERPRTTSSWDDDFPIR